MNAAVCFANQDGGTLLVGVRDRTRGRTAIVGIGALDVTRLRREIYNETSPSILVEIEELPPPEGRLLAIHVPRGLPPHTTSKGLALIRVGDACMPLTGDAWTQMVAVSGATDASARVIRGTGVEMLDPVALEDMRARLEPSGQASALTRGSDADMMAGLNLTVDGELTLAALVLVGRAHAIARYVPQHEITLARFGHGASYEARDDLRGPLLTDLQTVEGFIGRGATIRTVRPAGFTQLELPTLTWEVAREAVLNAVSHRDYFVSQGILLALRPTSAELTSPGGFLGGVTPENILRHPPAHRNELLVRALRQLNLVNRVGEGVDRIYEGLLRAGARPPAYRADEASVTVELPLGGSDAFAAWVFEHERLEPLSLDDLLLLRRLMDVGSIDSWIAAATLQLPEEQALSRLSDLRRRGLLLSHGRGRAAAYALTRSLSTQLRGRALTDADRPLEAEGVRLRVIDLLRERGELSNAEIRELSGYSRQQVVTLERRLVEEGEAHFRGRGRGARLVAGPPTPDPALGSGD